MSLPETVEVHKLTVREFHALEPLLDPDRRHELLDGQILVMPPPRKPHTAIWRRLQRQLLRQQRPGLCVWEGGLVLDENAELWPDLTLLADDPDLLPGRDNPSAAAAKLVIEVSDTTLGHDTGDKLRAYQQAGVPEYWVVDVQACRVLRYLAPDYRGETVAGNAPEGLLNAPSTPPLSPQAYPDVSVDVGALFTGW